MESKKSIGAKRNSFFRSVEKFQTGEAFSFNLDENDDDVVIILYNLFRQYN